MQREPQASVEGLIKLGQASVETQGSVAEPYPELFGTNVIPPMIQN